MNTAPPLRVLLIENHKADQELIQNYLRLITQRRLTVGVVNSLADGLARLATEQFDIILLDLSLPDSQGLTTCSKIQSQTPDTPLIVLTGVNDENRAVEAMQRGAQDYLVKNEINSNLLYRAIRYAIERHAARKRQWLDMERMRLMTRRLPAMIWSTDTDLKITSSTGTALGLLADDHDQLVGQPLETYFDAAAKSRAWLALPGRYFTLHFMLNIRCESDYTYSDLWELLGEKRRRLLDRSWAGVFRAHLLPVIPVQKLADQFDQRLGRPTKELHVVVGTLILQQLHNLTDQQTVEALSFNIAWQYALDIQEEADAYLCERTLRNYRKILVEHNLDQEIFHSLTDQLIRTLDIKTSRQRLDSTTVTSAIRGLTRLGILVEATSKFLRELRRKCPEDFALVDAEVIRKYLERQGDGCFANTKPSESKRRLPEAANDVCRLLQQFQNQPARHLESFQLLTRIFHEQCEVEECSEPVVTVRPPAKTDCDTVINPADPDARYNKHKGTGYSVQIMETFDPEEANEGTEISKPDLITHVAVDPLNQHDQEALIPALEDVESREIKPEELLADTHYGSMGCLDSAQELGVEVVARSQTPKGKLQGKLTLEDFELDEEGRVIRCPERHAPVETRVADVRLQVLFDGEICEACPRKDSCQLSAVGRKSPRYQYTHDRVRSCRRRQHEKTKDFKNRYRWRAGVEGTMSRYKHQMGMGKLRVRGMKMIRYTATLRALGLNIRRTAAFRAASA